MSSAEHAHGGGESSFGFLLRWIFTALGEYIDSLGKILGYKDGTSHH